MTHGSALLVIDMSCVNMGQYQLNSNSNIGACVCVCVRARVRMLFKYEAITVAGLQKLVT